MWASYHVRVPGKWVLTGEHAVLAGGEAVALPHPEFGLTLSFQPQVWPEGGERILVVPESATPVLRDLLKSAFSILREKGASFQEPSGTLQIESTIPIGAGLGSSAALCVAITRWIAAAGLLPESQILSFATQLEHHFHGKSSGMDIAVIALGEPIAFSMGRAPIPLGTRRIPRFTFHDTGLRSSTRECVAKVELLRRTSGELAKRLDQTMADTALMAMEGLAAYNSGNPEEREQGLDMIAHGMRQAQECFYQWKLVPAEAQKIERELMKKGAMGVKMTGAGAGGMLVALWPDHLN